MYANENLTTCERVFFFFVSACARVLKDHQGTWLNGFQSNHGWNLVNLDCSSNLLEYGCKKFIDWEWFFHWHSNG